MKKQKKKLDPKLVGIFDDLIDESITSIPLPDIPAPQEIPRQIIMFWREEKCQRCHKTYKSSAYGMDLMLQLELQKPIVHFGRFYGWKYVGIRFVHIPDLSLYDHLPRQIETIKSTIRNCPNCVHRPEIIYLEDQRA